jgi:hypothetical protein
MSQSSVKNGSKTVTSAEDPEEKHETDTEKIQRLEGYVDILENELSSIQGKVADDLAAKDQAIADTERQIQASQALELRAWRKLEDTRDAYYGLADEMRKIQDGTHPAFQAGSSQ